MVRPADPNTIAALRGSRTGDQLTVWAWYNGALAWPTPLNIAQWSLDWDDSREWGTANLTVADPTGRLAPWLLEDPLGTGGARLQIIYRVGGAGTINLGWFRPQRTQPAEKWAGYTVTEAGTLTPGTPVPPGKRLHMQPMGATIQVTARDLAGMVADDRFVAPESPQGASPTVIGEIRRLLSGRVPVTVLPGVTDTAVNTSLIYQQQGDRWAAVQDLARRLSAAVRMNGDGQCEVYPITPAAPAITLTGGPAGVTVRVDRSQDTSSVPLYNIFVADGTGTDASGNQTPIRGVAQINAGPLRVDGPNGRVPKFYSSNMITTQAQADAAAAQMRDTQIAGATTDLDIECAPMPHLQVGDWATGYTPRPDGGVPAVTGRIVKASLKGTQTAVDRMSLTVRCDYAAVKTAFTGPANNSIVGPLTR